MSRRGTPTRRKPLRRRLPSAAPSMRRAAGRRTMVIGGLALGAVLAGLLAAHSSSWATGIETALAVTAACAASAARPPR